MEFSFALGYLGAAVLILGSIAIGIAFYFVGDPQFNFEWVVSAIGAFVGGFVTSELFIGLRDYQPVYDGLALVPALIGGVIVGGVVAAITRLLTRGRFSPQAR